MAEPVALPMDAHVHLHRRRWVEPALYAAAGNFRAAPGAPASGVLGVLLLTQAADEQVFEWLYGRTRVGEWQVEPVPAERQSLWLANAGNRLLVVCGRQIQAERGLEALALGTDEPIADGMECEATLDRIRAAGALPVLPWGFGKWIGSRGARIRQVLAGQPARDVWLGDNGGRPRGLARPRLLAAGEQRGVRILPGSDPFPFGGDCRRVGSFGCLLPGQVNVLHPWRSIVEQLQQLPSSPPRYGRCTGWLRFAVNQVWIQVYTRLHHLRAA